MMWLAYVSPPPPAPPSHPPPSCWQLVAPHPTKHGCCHPHQKTIGVDITIATGGRVTMGDDTWVLLPAVLSSDLDGPLWSGSLSGSLRQDPIICWCSRSTPRCWGMGGPPPPAPAPAPPPKDPARHLADSVSSLF